MKRMNIFTILLYTFYPRKKITLDKKFSISMLLHGVSCNLKNKVYTERLLTSFVSVFNYIVLK